MGIETSTHHECSFCLLCRLTRCDEFSDLNTKCPGLGASGKDSLSTSFPPGLWPTMSADRLASVGKSSVKSGMEGPRNGKALRKPPSNRRNTGPNFFAERFALLGIAPPLVIFSPTMRRVES